MNGRRARLSARLAVGVAVGLAGVLTLGTAGGASAATAPAAVTKSPTVLPFSGLTPAQIKTKSVAAARAATSVHVSGTAVDKGQSIKFDGVFSGKRARMTLTAPAFGTEYVVRDGNTFYISGDQKFWLLAGKGNLTAKGAAALVGKWGKVKGTDPKLAFVKYITSVSFWVDQVNVARPTKRVPGKVVGGVPTVGLFEPGTLGGTLYVATKGTPYPMSIVATNKSASVTMTGWNAQPVVSLPAKSSLI